MNRLDRVERRNETIRKEFLELRNENINGVRKYRIDGIVEILAEKYFLAPVTVFDIIYYRGSYRVADD